MSKLTVTSIGTPSITTSLTLATANTLAGKLIIASSSTDSYFQGNTSLGFYVTEQTIGPSIGLKANTTTVSVGPINGYPFIFLMNNGEAGRFTTDGNFGVGNTAPSNKLSVNGTAYFGGNTTITGGVSVTGNAVFSNTVTVAGNATFSNTVTLAASGITFSDATTMTTLPSGGFTNISTAERSAVYNSTGTPMVYNSTGSATFTIPAGVTKIKVTVVGGGGGSSPQYGFYLGGSGGGGGGTAIKIISGLTPGVTVAITVGAGGAAGLGGAGGTGGTSQFAAYCSATGGAGGSYGGGAGVNGGAGGIGSSGSLNIGGNAGETGEEDYTYNFYLSGGVGGGSFLGGGGRGGGYAYAPTAGQQYGGGAGGGGYADGNGRAGASGIVVVEY